MQRKTVNKSRNGVREDGGLKKNLDMNETWHKVEFIKRVKAKKDGTRVDLELIPDGEKTEKEKSRERKMNRELLNIEELLKPEM